MLSRKVDLAENTITGELAQGKERKRLLVICHGLNDSNENPNIIAITKGLNDLGHDTYTFNFSENSGGFDIEQQVRDIKHILEHFKEYKEVVLIAASFSALPAAIATAKLPHISGLITVNGFFGLSALGKNHRRSFRKFKLAATVVPKYKRIYTYYKSQLKPAEISVPTLVIHARNDQFVYIKQSQYFYEKLSSPKRFRELANANHGITAKQDREIVVRAVHKWLSE